MKKETIKVIKNNNVFDVIFEDENGMSILAKTKDKDVARKKKLKFQAKLKKGVLLEAEKSVYTIKSNKDIAERQLLMEEARDELREWIATYTMCEVQKGWACGTCLIGFLSELGVYEDKQHNKPIERCNEVWRAILQIREHDNEYKRLEKEEAEEMKKYMKKMRKDEEKNR